MKVLYNNRTGCFIICDLKKKNNLTVTPSSCDIPGYELCNSCTNPYSCTDDKGIWCPHGTCTN